jgi:hypothetical protein
MQIVHEFGHCLHAWISGGRVTRIVLHPLAISRTDVAPNPHPQFVAWGGPIWGGALPLGLFWAVRRSAWPRAWLLRFFAGFCLVANGGYLLGGAVNPVGDAEVLLREGAPRFSLVAFGIAAVVLGLALWNRLGRHFGIGRDALPIDRSAAIAVALVAIVVVTAELLWNALRS